jgi:outer membrane receptor for ferrienterochelin and colicin
MKSRFEHAFPQRTPITQLYTKLIYALAIAFLVLPITLFAQATSSEVRGVVTDTAGSAIPNASVNVRNELTGLQRNVLTDSSGIFRVSNLPIGDNYRVTVSSDNFESRTSEAISVQLGQTANVDFVLQAPGAMEEVVITGSRLVAVQVAVGPSAVFGIEELEQLPAINRNITDVLRADPRIYINESQGGENGIQCGGKNSRFNSLTVDGVRMNDSFGLNRNGYPTERMPFSYDAIQQISAEMAPFDVEYGQFEACNINAVTKSGTNEFYGSGFYDYTNDSMRGDSLEGDPIVTGDYSEKRYGINIGGPIIKDKLFFFAAYEKLEGANLFDRGPIGSGAVNEINVTQAELDEILNIARTNYLYDPGFIPLSKDHEDEKLLIKLDWNISDRQRLSFTYNWNDGENFSESDDAQNEFEFSNHLYERGAELKSYVATLYSDWNTNFSTEIRASYLEIDNRQISVGGTDFGEMRIELDDVDVYIGADDSRHANKLDYDVTTLVFKGRYDLNGHFLTFGVEREELEVFNMFVQHVETEIRFDGMENFRNGFADAMYYNNAPSQNPEDAAALWGYETNTVYLQDEFFPVSRLQLVIGARYDWYTTSDKPAENADFVADYGFSNSQTLDGEGLFQPRVGFVFDITSQDVLRGGIGLYSGGNPNVWLSNNYSANNVLQFGQRGRSFGYTDGSRSLFDEDVIYEAIEANAPDGAGPGWGVPQELYDAVAAGVGDNFEINYLDPNFKIPSEWKFAIGYDHFFDSGMRFSADLLITEGKNSAMVLHGDIDQVGTNEDGYPIYDSVREPSFVLTNSDKGNRSKTLSFILAQSHDNGIDWNVGYAWNDAEDIQPMTSSVAFSNYTNRAFFDPQEDVRSPSNYNIEHRLTGTFRWAKQVWGLSTFRLAFFGTATSGQPYSYAFDGTIDPYGFTPYLDFLDIVLEPGDTRNSETNSSWSKLDMRMSLDFRGFRVQDRGEVFLIVDNLTNLLNDDWGVLTQHNFPATVPRGTIAPRIGDASRYEIRVGVMYSF